LAGGPAGGPWPGRLKDSSPVVRGPSGPAGLRRGGVATWQVCRAGGPAGLRVMGQVGLCSLVDLRYMDPACGGPAVLSVNCGLEKPSIR
jgi:hypothetical protein